MDFVVVLSKEGHQSIWNNGLGIFNIHCVVLLNLLFSISQFEEYQSRWEIVAVL